MESVKSSSLIDNQVSLVIDVTYNCNGNCLYCQWRARLTNAGDLSSNGVLIPSPTIESLGIERIVLSGGEPLLRKDLEEIISYYSKLNIDSIVVITNGLLLDLKRLNSLVNAGITGVTFSLDGLSEKIAYCARGLSMKQHHKVLDNVDRVLDCKKSLGLEVGVNTVVSSANLDVDDMSQLIHFCNKFNVDWIKFQPVFDDGYLGNNAPWLKLREQDSDLIRRIGNKVISNTRIETNPYDFWESIALLLEGKKLLGTSCGLDSRQAIAIRGAIKFCFWMDSPIYGLSSKSLTPVDIEEARARFKTAKRNCVTGMHCFCLQKFDQKWVVA